MVVCNWVGGPSKGGWSGASRSVGEVEGCCCGSLFFGVFFVFFCLVFLVSVMFKYAPPRTPGNVGRLFFLNFLFFFLG